MKEDMNLIHRDVKPSNILLNRHGQVKICDFGISGHLTNSLAKVSTTGWFWVQDFWKWATFSDGSSGLQILYATRTN